MSQADIVKYQDPKSILVIGQHGKLRQLYVPFRVRCIQPLERVPLDALVYVELVMMHPKYVLLYWANQQAYPYHHFRIELNF